MFYYASAKRVGGGYRPRVSRHEYARDYVGGLVGSAGDFLPEFMQ